MLRSTPRWRDFASALVRELFGCRAALDRMTVLRARPAGAVVLLTVHGRPRLVLKVATVAGPGPVLATSASRG